MQGQTRSWRFLPIEPHSTAARAVMTRKLSSITGKKQSEYYKIIYSLSFFLTQCIHVHERQVVESVVSLHDFVMQGSRRCENGECREPGCHGNRASGGNIHFQADCDWWTGSAKFRHGHCDRSRRYVARMIKSCHLLAIHVTFCLFTFPSILTC